MEIIESIQKPLIEELNNILERNVTLLYELCKLENEMKVSPVRDLPSYIKKMEHRLSNIKNILTFNDSLIEDIQKKIEISLHPFLISTSIVGSLNNPLELHSVRRPLGL